MNELESSKFKANAKKNGVVNSKGRIAQSPKEMTSAIDVDARGTPQIEWYGKELNRYIDEIAQEPITTDEKGKNRFRCGKKPR